MGDHADLSVADGSLQGAASVPPALTRAAHARTFRLPQQLHLFHGPPCNDGTVHEPDFKPALLQQVNDVEVDGGWVGKGQGVLVER